MNQHRHWFAIARGEKLGNGGKAYDIPEGKEEFFNVETCTWWAHFGEATKFSNEVAAEAMLAEHGFGFRDPQGVMMVMPGYEIVQFNEERGPTTTLGEDRDDGDWWKRV